MTKHKIQHFQKKILWWYVDHKRSLPRRDSSDPYAVLVSEVMSQQTQVERVVPKYERFMKTLPNLSDLATCEKSLLLQLRSWLWFNSRAIRLQKAAQIICDEYNWAVPASREILLWLPGIWPYTSASICAFAFNLSEPVVDTNIRRVLIYELWLDKQISVSELEKIARDCIPAWESNDWHNALMDYGALVATSKHTWIKPLSKQSRFKGSDREVRWWILKQLTSWIQLDLNIVSKQFPNKEVKSIIRWMVQDHLIQDNTWILSI